MNVTSYVVGAVLSCSLLTGCATRTTGNNEVGGTVVGGVAGALVGSQFGGGSGRIVGAALGAAGGAYVGNQVGRSMDESQRPAQGYVYSRPTAVYAY